MSRVRKNGLTALAAFILAAPVVWACSDGPDNPAWALRKPDYDAYGASAMLAPSNDTRVNLALVMADRSGMPPGETGPGPLFTWDRLRSQIAPTRAEEEGNEFAGSRCQTRASGEADFAAALTANPAVPASEREALLTVRKNFDFNCSDAANPVVPELALESVKSQQGKQFAQYLQGAAAFYAGDFAAATRVFSDLANARDAWLRETAAYMAARSDINRAQTDAFDDWGSIASPRRNDQAAARAAASALQAYLQAWPQGRYAGSAQGLLRRAHWLGGQDAELASAYSDTLARSSGPAIADTAQELDNKLLFTVDAANFTDPAILAVSDLMRMRKASEEAESDRKPITRAELERQKQYFANTPDLYSYLLAAEALYLRNQPGEVLALIPDASHQNPFTYLQFSRQMLRGMALDAAKDPNARQFWLDLFDGATAPWQHEAIELAYAMHEERNGGLANVFAKGSPVRNAVIREILLENVAGADLLRQQARDTALAKREREAALWTLLAKNLSHGQFRDFLNDLKLVPADASTDSGQLNGARFASTWYDPSKESVSLGTFTGHGSNGDFGCPALAVTVERLARNPKAATPRLCLGEFWRSNDFDPSPYDTALTPDELGGTPSLFAGKQITRQSIYQEVMADRTATPDEQAYALYRAVRCYAPAGQNDCGGADVTVSQRRAWFNRLKAQFPRSRWAQSLKFYW
ncbi:MAG: hypothetical protein AB7F98_16305 [Novosphingobium sp.]